MAAPLVTVAAVGAGVALTSIPTTNPSLDLADSVGQAAGSLADREVAASRSFDRMAVAGAANLRKPEVTAKRWTTEDLAIRTGPSKDAKVEGEIEFGKQVGITGVRVGKYAEVIVGGTARWVTAEYLDKKKPSALEGLSNEPCPDGSGIEGGLQSGAVRVYRAACAAFPELSSYGGQDGHGEHVNGEAIDFMVPSSEVGERLKDFLYAHRYELNLFDIIWSRSIWTIERDGEGFRGMSDRGGATANHYDHVHIKIN